MSKITIQNLFPIRSSKKLNKHEGTLINAGTHCAILAMPANMKHIRKLKNRGQYVLSRKQIYKYLLIDGTTEPSLSLMSYLSPI